MPLQEEGPLLIMSFRVGQTVGGYEFLEELGDARFGQAYKVRNTLVGRLEVLRLLPVDQRADKEQLERFLREIKIHARLSDPHVAAFYNAIEIDGQLVMTTELVEGLTLAEMLEKGPIEAGEAIRYAIQALDALAHAHANGVVHREIASANIRVSPTGAVKLGGFGLAKALSDPQLTQAGTVMGWIEYMAPEQVQGGVVDQRTDLYSLGVVLFEMLTGLVPFTGKTQFDVLKAQVTQEPPQPSTLNPSVSPALESVILRVLAKDPDSRFQTAGEFSRALENCLQVSGRASADKAEAARKALPSVSVRATPLAAPDISRLVGAGVVTFLVAAIAFFLLFRFVRW
jgi:eukaryotic-like serine/threonine-protein kinase